MKAKNSIGGGANVAGAVCRTAMIVAHLGAVGSQEGVIAVGTKTDRGVVAVLAALFAHQQGRPVGPIR